MKYLSYYIPLAPNKISGECQQGNVNFSDTQLSFFSKKVELDIFNDNRQEQFI